MADVRPHIVSWANWGVTNHSGFNYTEGLLRMSGINKPGVLPCSCDCSAFVTYCYNWAGAPDPNGQGYNGTGYTGTLLEHGTPITVSEAIPGDVIVYGPGTGEHTAIIVQAGNDPLTVSMGEQGDPNYVRVSQDGRQPQRYLRFSTDSSSPAPPAPAPQPSETCNVQLRVLGQGSSGGDVQSVQKLVGGIIVDGQYGPATAAAVKSFQVKYPISGTADGIVGPATWTALLTISR